MYVAEHLKMPFTLVIMFSDEFNDALTALAVGLLSGVSALGLEEEFVDRMFDRIVLMLLERIQKGYTYEQLMEFLTVKVGLAEKDAKELLDAVLEAMEEEPADGEE
jgi:hypothetical protein